MYELGREYALKGDDEQALAALNQAISVDANFAEAYLEAAFIYHDIEEEKKAKEYARRADELGASVGEPFRLKTQGLLYELDGDLDRALQTYQLLVRRYPRDADAHLYLASVAMWMGRHDEARVSLLACLTIDPTNPYCHYNLMMLQIRRNEFDEVIAAYESLRRKGVEYPWFDEPVGVAYWGKEDSNKAAAHFQRLTTARVGGFKVHGSVHFRTAKEWLAGMAIYQGKLKESRRLIDQLATEAASSDVPATYLLELAKTQAFVGNRALAIEYAKTAVSTTNDPCIRLDAGLLATGLEEHPTRSQPSAPPRECPETYLSRGTLALAQEETDTAIQQLSMSAERDENLEARYLLAHAYMHERRWQDAITQLNIVASSKGTILLDYPASVWPLSHYDLAVCYEGLGKYEQALLHYSEFLKTWDGADAGLQPLVRAKERLAVVSGKR